MTTCVVVRKNNEIAIAVDSLVTFGDMPLSYAYESNEKIFQIGDSYIALADTTAHFPVMKKLLTEMDKDGKLHTREDVFEPFTRTHQILKEKFFLNTKEEEDDPYESSQITTLIANASGILGVYSYREVFAFVRFWAIGSGKTFAFGAMYAAYDHLSSARAIAELGVNAGAEFDKSSSLPCKIFNLPVQ